MVYCNHGIGGDYTPSTDESVGFEGSVGISAYPDLEPLSVSHEGGGSEGKSAENGQGVPDINSDGRSDKLDEDLIKKGIKTPEAYQKYLLTGEIEGASGGGDNPFLSPEAGGGITLSVSDSSFGGDSGDGASFVDSVFSGNSQGGNSTGQPRIVTRET